MSLFKKQDRELQDLLRVGTEEDFNNEVQDIEKQMEKLRDRKRAIRDERIRRQDENRNQLPDTSHLDQVVGP
jgi:hypothetical protein